MNGPIFSSPGMQFIKLGPGQYGKMELYNEKKRQQDIETKSLSINTKEFGVLVFLKPTPIGFNSRAERFKGLIGREIPPGTLV